MRIRHLFLAVFLMVLPSFSARSEVVTPSQARKVAEHFFNALPMTKTMDIRLVWTAEGPATRTSSEAAFYVFNRDGGGFVIVAADDAAKPIIGYSYHNSFSCKDMPENLAEWADNICGQIEDGRASGAKASRETADLWADALGQTRAGADTIPSELLMETASWGQGTPYNTCCPEVEGTKAATGCVATAYGIVMYYYKYPAYGTGTIPGYTYEKNDKSYSVPSRVLGHRYDWDNMKMSYKKGTYTEAEGNAVGLLLYDLAVMGKSSFGSSTSSSSKRMASAASTYMGYDKAFQQLYRGYYGDELWFSLVRKELQHNPMPYSCNVHAFVVDGYDTQGRLHVNWGWSGQSNGYYAVDAFIPSGSSNYTKSNNGIFNFRPDEGGMTVPMLKLSKGTFSSGKTYAGLDLVSGDIFRGMDFTVTAGCITNVGADSFSGEIALALCSRDGNIREFVSEARKLSLKSGYMTIKSNIICRITLEPNDGDKVKLFFRSDGQEEWAAVYFSNEEDSDFVGELPAGNARTFTDNTSLSYNKNEKIFSVSSYGGAYCTLKDASGGDFSQIITDKGEGEFTFSKENLTPGRYTLTVTFCNFNKDIKIVAGR